MARTRGSPKTTPTRGRDLNAIARRTRGSLRSEGTSDSRDSSRTRTESPSPKKNEPRKRRQSGPSRLRRNSLAACSLESLRQRTPSHKADSDTDEDSVFEESFLTDYEDAEVEKLLSAEGIEMILDSAVTPTLLGELVLWLVIYALLFLLGVWALIWIAFFIHEYWRYIGPAPAQIPLQFLAWSAATNSMHTRDLIKATIPVQQVGEVEFHTMAVGSFASEIERVANRPDISSALQTYVNQIGQLQTDTAAFSVRAAASLRSVSRELSKAEKLLVHLNPDRWDTTQPRDYDAEDALMSIMTDLHSRLPKDLNDLTHRFSAVNTTMYNLFYHLQSIGVMLSENEAALDNALHLKPPTGRLLKQWQTDPAIQRRGTWYKLTMASFKAVVDMEHAFVALDEALISYRRVLPLLESPRGVSPKHSPSTASFQNSMSRVREVMPQLHEFMEMFAY